MSFKRGLGALELAFIVIALLVVAYVGGPSIVGFITKEVSFTEQPALVVTASGEYSWEPREIGELLSLKVDGSFTNNGSAKVYLESSGIRKLVFDSSQIQEDQSEAESTGVFNTTLSAITGFVQLNNAPVYVGSTSFEVEGKTKINLDKQFTDSEKDKLSFSANSPLNLELEIKNGQLTVTPDDDFVGERTAFITASDGTTTTEQAITLVVVQSKKEDEAQNETQETDETTPEPIEPLTNNTITEAINETEETANVTLPVEEEVNAIIPINETALNETTINETITNETTPKTITNGLSYGDNPLYDVNNDGVETLTGVIDFSIEDTSFDFDADLSKLCTRFEVYSLETEEATQFCNGNFDCCAFVDLASSSDSWDSPYFSTYNKHGATENNIVSSQVIYYDVNLSIDNLKSDIVTSSWENLTAKYANSYVEFSNQCLETCSLSGFNKTSYRLIFEIEGEVVLKIDALDYTVRQDAGNNPPTLIANISNITMIRNREYVLNLSNQFYDSDGDSLSFSYYKPSNITILFNGTMATIVPDEGYTGTAFTFISANDSDSSVTSNIFRIDVVESIEEITQRVSVGEPVVWTEEILVSDLVNDTLSLEIPETALNVTVDVVSGVVSEEILQTDITVEDNGEEQNAKEFHDEKQIEKLERKMALLEEGREKGAELVILEGQNVTKEEFLQAIPELTQEKEDLEGGVFFAPTIEDSDNISTVVVENITTDSPLADTVVVEYVTEAPVMIQTALTPTLHEVLITSETHYTNVFVGADIPESTQSKIAVYWVINETRTLFSNVTYLDTNLDGLINRLEWYVPHLSNQTFEIVTDSSTQWDEGTFVNMVTKGSGGGANLTSSGRNESGSYGSKIYDAGASSHWKNITWRTPIPYGDEIGRVPGEHNNASLESGLVNISGLILLFYGNNESGENNTLVKDYSVALNPERAGQRENNGTLRGGAHYNFTEKEFGAASLDFDGIDDDLIVYDNPSLDFGASDFSVSVWLNQRGTCSSWDNTWGPNKWNTGGSPGTNEWAFGLCGGGAGTINLFGFSIENGTTIYSASDPSTHLTNRWYYLVGVRNGSSLYLYVDNTLVGSANVGSVSVNNVGRDFFLANAYPNSLQTNIIHDEISIWNRSLSASEIRNLYLRGANRLNLSVRSCDDSSCNGESWTNMGSNGTFGRVLPLSVANNRYFQYNLTYSRNDSFYNDTIVNNVTLSYVQMNNTLTNCSVLNQSEVYVLANSISTTVPTNSPCFNITASGVTLDCQGLVINGSGTRSYGLHAESVNSITIRNCTFKNWGEYGNGGSAISFTGVNGSTIVSMNLSQNLFGIVTTDSDSLVINKITSNSNSGYSLHLITSDYNNISDVTANGNQIGVYLQGSSSNLLSNITTNSNSMRGLYLQSSSNSNTVVNATANSNNEYGIYLYSSSSNTILNSTANSNTLFGLYSHISGLNLIANSTIQNNTLQDIGVAVSSDSHCNNLFQNVTSSYGRPIEWYNYSVNLENRTLAQLILCNADGSNLTNITIDGSAEKDNNGLFLYRTDNARLSNINSSDNYYGISMDTSTSNNLNSIVASSNAAGGISLTSSSLNNLSGLTTVSNVYGIFTSSSDSNRFINLISNLNNYGISFFVTSSSNIISNATFVSNPYGVYLNGNSNYNNYSDITITSSTYGLYMRTSHYSTFTNFRAKSNAYGADIDGSTDSTFINWTINSSQYGLYLDTVASGFEMGRNNFTNFQIQDASNTGIYFRGNPINNNFFNTFIGDALTGVYLDGINNSFNFLTINDTTTSAIRTDDNTANATLRNVILSGCGTTNGGINNTGGTQQLDFNYIANYSCLLGNVSGILNNYSLSSSPFDSRATNGGFYLTQSGASVNAGSVQASDAVAPDGSFNLSTYYTTDLVDSGVADLGYHYPTYADIPLTNCSVLGIAGKTYTLLNNISTPVPSNSPCFNITASGVTLDCQGLFVNGTDDGYGVYAENVQGITIKNCTFTNWGSGIAFPPESGIYFDNVDNSTIRDVNSSSNIGGIFLTNSDGNNLTNLIANSNSYIAVMIYYSSYNLLSGITSTSNSNYGIWVEGSSSGMFNNITSSSNGGYGFYLASPSTLNNISHITTNSNVYGLRVENVNNNRILNATSNSNSIGGLSLASSSSNGIFNATFQNNTQQDVILTVSSDSHCNNLLINVTSSYGRAIEWYNYSVSLENRTLSQLILCNADGSNLTNITIDGSSTIDNNGLFVYRTDNATLRNINSSDNYHGVYLDTSSANTVVNVTANSNTLAGVYFTSSASNYVANITALSNTNYGIYALSSNSNTFTNMTSSFGTHGMWLQSSSSNIISHSLFEGNSFGLRLWTPVMPHNNVSKITTLNNAFGIDIVAGVGSRISDSLSKGSTYGIIIDSGALDGIITNMTLVGNQYGIYINGADRYNITNSYIYNSTSTGIHFLVDSIKRNNNFTFFNTLIQNATTGIYLNGRENTFNSLTINATSQSAIYVNEGNVSATIRNAIISGCVNPNIGGINNSAGVSQLDFNYIANHSCRLGNVSGILNNYSLSSSPFDTRPTNGGFYLTQTSAAVNAGSVQASDAVAPDRSFNLSIYYTTDVVDSGVADLGYHYSTYADIPLTNCSVLGIAGKTYTLLNNISTPVPSNSPCFNITASGVTLDCQGLFVNGSDDGFGVYAENVQGITIKNCSFWNWGDEGAESGIYFIQVGNSTVKYVNASLNNFGARIAQSSQNNVSNSLFMSNSQTGLQFVSSSAYNTITNVTMSSNFNGFWLSVSSFNTIINLTSTLSSSLGFIIQSSSNNMITGANIYSNTAGGMSFSDSSLITVANSTIQNNTVQDILLSASLDTYCSNRFENVTSSYGRPIEWYNYSVKLENRTLAQLILCNADGSNLTNITIDAEQTKDNNGLFVYRTDNATLRNINSSDNYYGMYVDTSTSNNFSSIWTVSNAIHGVYLVSSSNSNRFNQVTTSSNSQEGINLNSGDSNNFNNIISVSNQNGLVISTSSNNISNVISNSSTGAGIQVSGNRNRISNLTGNSNNQLLSFNNAYYNVITNVTGSLNQYGLSIGTGGWNNITSAEIRGSTNTGVYMNSNPINSRIFNVLVYDSPTGVLLDGINNSFEFLTINDTTIAAIQTADGDVNATLRNIILSGCGTTRGGINNTGGALNISFDYVANYSCLLGNVSGILNNYSLSTYPFDEWLPTSGFGGFYLNQSSLAVDAGDRNSSDTVSPDRGFNLSTYSTGRYADYGTVDLGYHYPTGPIFTLRIQLRTLNDAYIANQFVNLTDPPNLGIGPWFDQSIDRMNTESNNDYSNNYANDIDGNKNGKKGNEGETNNALNVNAAAITGMAAVQKSASGLLPLHLILLSVMLSVLLAVSVYWTSSGAGKAAPIASFIIMLLLSVSVIFAFSGITGDYTLVIGNVPWTSAHNVNGSGYNLTFQLVDEPIGRANSSERNITLGFPYISTGSLGAGFVTFDGSTTNFNEQAQITNVCKPVLEKSAYGKIEWKNCVNAENQNFDAHVSINHNVIDVRSSSLHSTFNSSANVTLYSLTGIRYPLILKNDEVCTDCTILSWDDQTRTAVFNVTSFSNYTAAEANQSKITNYGLQNQSAFLLMKVQFFDSDTSSWIDSNVLENLTPQTVENLSLLKLDAIFNGRWNTSANATFGSGSYRVYAAAITSVGDVLQNTEGSLVEASYNFSVDLSQEAPTVNVDIGGGFIIQNASGSTLMAIDSSGNVNIKGALFQNAQPLADSNDFTITNSTGGITAVLRNPQGNLHLRGSASQSVPSLSPTLNSFIIQNSTGSAVAYFNSTGHLLIKGTLSQNVNFG